MLQTFYRTSGHQEHMASPVLATLLILNTKDGQQLYIHANQQLFYNEVGEASFIVCSVERWSKVARGGEGALPVTTSMGRRMGAHHTTMVDEEREKYEAEVLRAQHHKPQVEESAEPFHLVGGKKKRKRVVRVPASVAKRGRSEIGWEEDEEEEEADEDEHNKAGRKGGKEDEKRREEDAVRLLELVKKRHN